MCERSLFDNWRCCEKQCCFCWPVTTEITSRIPGENAAFNQEVSLLFVSCECAYVWAACSAGRELLEHYGSSSAVRLNAAWCYWCDHVAANETEVCKESHSSSNGCLNETAVFKLRFVRFVCCSLRQEVWVLRQHPLTRLSDDSMSVMH